GELRPNVWRSGGGRINWGRIAYVSKKDWRWPSKLVSEIWSQNSPPCGWCRRRYGGGARGRRIARHRTPAPISYLCSEPPRGHVSRSCRCLNEAATGEQLTDALVEHGM